VQNTGFIKERRGISKRVNKRKIIVAYWVQSEDV
jgi:hypothetical protein